MDNCVILLSAHLSDTHRETSAGFKPQRVQRNEFTALLPGESLPSIGF